MMRAFGGGMLTLHCCVAWMDLGYVIGSVLMRQVDIWTYVLAAIGTMCAYIWVRTTIAIFRLKRGVS